MTKGNGDTYGGENYDQVVYYVAPAVLVVAILFCCFRMALVYYMQIRPRRGQTSTVHASSTREGERQSPMGSIPAACQEIFLRMPPPPNYETTLKNDRRSMSAIETNTTQQASELVLQVEQPTEQQRVPDQQPSSQAAPEALRRVQSNVEAVPPASNLGPPAYSRRLSIEALDSRVLNLRESTRLRLPSYEEAVLEPESRRPTLDV